MFFNWVSFCISRCVYFDLLVSNLTFKSIQTDSDGFRSIHMRSYDDRWIQKQISNDCKYIPAGSGIFCGWFWFGWRCLIPLGFTSQDRPRLASFIYCNQLQFIACCRRLSLAVAWCYDRFWSTNRSSSEFIRVYLNI